MVHVRRRVDMKKKQCTFDLEEKLIEQVDRRRGDNITRWTVFRRLLQLWVDGDVEIDWEQVHRKEKHKTHRYSIDMDPEIVSRVDRKRGYINRVTVLRVLLEKWVNGEIDVKWTEN